ncbi:hypothetical protein Tco_0582082 [Tanacetum coccineum]
MVISSPCLIDNKELTSPEQTAPGSAEFHQIFDFLNRSHICYALTKKPEGQAARVSNKDWGKSRRRAKVVLFENDEEIADDSSKHWRKLSDAKVQDKASNETEPVIQDVTPTEVILDQESSEKGSAEVSTAGAIKDIAREEVLIVSTAEENLSTTGGTITYTRRSAEKRLSYAEAIRLEEQMNEEQRAQIARDEEIARQWDKEERKRAMDEAKTAKKIDWNDPSVI